jgi:hypothetical protein
VVSGEEGEEVKVLGAIVLTIVGAVISAALYVVYMIIDDYFKGR